MSKGLGISYVNDTKNVSWHRADVKGRMYMNVGDGKKASMPRYYKDRIYTKNQRRHISKHIDVTFAEKVLADLMKEWKSSDPVGYRNARLRTERETMNASYARAKTKSLKQKSLV